MRRSLLIHAVGCQSERFAVAYRWRYSLHSIVYLPEEALTALIRRQAAARLSSKPSVPIC